MEKNKTFSFDTIENFDNHIQLSIPIYNDLQELIKKISPYFVISNTNIYDIGCSTGSLLKSINSPIGSKKYGIDISKNLLPQNTDNTIFLEIDVNNFKFFNASFIYSLFTLQFLPIFQRANILQSIYNGLVCGGATIIAEKIFYKNTKINSIITSLYYEFKNQNFSAQEILDKERDLRYLMRPLTTRENIKLLKSAGFSNIEVIKKDYQFEVYLCIK